MKLTCDLTEYTPVSELPSDHRYFQYQDVNKNGAPSERVIDEHIQSKGEEYRQELAGKHPVERLRPKA